MDVDLLRPGTVPISKDTIMWFEFLLDPSILESHLSKPKPDPSPAELISKFLSISADITGTRDLMILDLEIETDDKPIQNRRSLGLKILALKTAAIINWDLEILESKLPFYLQWALLQDMLSLVHGEMMSGDISKEPDHVLFAVSLYHRWALRALFNNAMHNKQRNTSAIDMLDERLLRLERESEHSVQVLSDISQLVLGSEVLVPSSATFIPLKEDNCDVNTPDWSLGLYISSSQFLTMVVMDLASYLFFQEDYTSALGYFQKCKVEYEKWCNNKSSTEPVYCKVDLDTLNGYITASQPPVLSPSLSLTDRAISLDIITTKMNSRLAFNNMKPKNIKREDVIEIFNSTALLFKHKRSPFLFCGLHVFKGILNILMEDNVKRELPVSLRERLELDIASAISSGGFTSTRDLIFQIQSVNTVYRRALDLPCSGLYDYAEKLATARRGCDIFLWALRGTIIQVTEEEHDRLSLFVVEILESIEPSIRGELLNYDLVRQVIKKYPLELPDAPSTQPPMQPFTPPDFNNIELKKNEWEQQLRLSYEPVVIRELVKQLTDANAIRSACQIDSKWELGIPLHGIVLGIPSLMGILQHYLYVLLGKAKYLDSLGRYETARRMLLAAEAEVLHHEGSHPSMGKLAQLITWEILLVESHHLHADWPNKTTGWETMTNRCLDVMQTTAGESAGVLPRVEIVEQAAVTLLNLAEWEALVTVVPDKRLILCDLSASLALACQDIVKFKGNKKVPRSAWELVVPVFGPTGVLGKRGQAGYDSSLLQPVVRFFGMLRDWTVLSAAISLLARLHNVLRDEVTLELGFEYTGLWPSVVSNASSYNIQLVSENLLQLVNSASEYYPKNPSLHKLLGDYYFVGSQHGAAIKNYLLAIIIATDNLSRPLTKAAVEDGVIKRMIKSLGQLNNHTQAGVLCQFLEEVDYNTAFKSFSETTSNDCMDTYYDCVWDVNILEYLIYLQNKRGNKDRAKKAIDMIGLLELNANNNEEIKREAANKRKVKFMQALIRQYVM